MEFSGRLTSFPFAELLNWANNDRRTGSLVVRRSSREKRVYFHHGKIIAVISDAPAEFYGQHLLHEGYLDHAKVFECLTICKRDGERLGVILRREGLLDEEQIEYTLQQHFSDLICDIFLWKHGIFYFHAEPPPKDELVSKPIDVLGLVMEGTRWIDETARIREVIADDGIVLAPSRRDIRPEGSFRRRRLFDSLNGEKTLQDVYERVGGSYFHFLTEAHALLKENLVEQVGKGPRHQTSLEIPIYDLLLEQAAEEQVLFSRKHFAIPLEVLERYVPVWVREPDEEEWQRMNEQVTDFFRRFDGNHRLTDLFSEDRGQRARETELLLLQMRKEAVALMPASLKELEHEAKEHSLPEKKRWWKKLFGLLGGEN